MQHEFAVREARAEDAQELCAILNAIIAKGGTTAYRDPLDVDGFTQSYLIGADFISCLVAEAADGELLGFQALEYRPGLPEDWADIATFAKLGSTARGIGTALFQSTLQLAQERVLTAINATIRSYNTGGLKYYAKMGFVEYKRAEAEPLDDGVPAEMIFHKRAV